MIRSKACQSGGLFYLGGESLTGLALKIKLSKELEKDAVDTKLSQLLQAFENKAIDSELISEEVESVRQEIYDKQKR